MLAPRSPRKTLKKFSTLLRPQTQENAYLNLYQLQIEKKRLTQEVGALESRLQMIQERLGVINAQIQNIEAESQQETPSSESNLSESKNKTVPPSSSTHSRETFTLDY